ncbi:ABC transporter substrate-binding protein [Actinomadura madurae]|uniref:ABC transporter substrate-binding protein n=1 Tax=Actinomadura madurae TaxID=1993 RepID=UPI002026F4D7|nr:ABC transporter substrate-binding protein [Actinomadura madurae]URN03512.1 ABC transporter substrate-binding protein [Actinomadura madurae]
MRRAIAALSAAALLAGTAACGANPPEAEGILNGKSSQGVDEAQLRQTLDHELHGRLPAKNKASGKLISVNNGSFPPYEIAGSDGRSLSGASADLTTALSQLLGVKIEHVTVDGLPSLLTGIKAGRYDFAMGPVGDFPEREAANDFVDWVREFVVFAVLKGNPKHINSITDTCGTKISVMAGGSAEDVVKKQSAKCVQEGKPAVEVQSYKDQPTAILAVRSHRVDGFFSSQAPLSYFVKQSGDDLELAGTGKPNGFDDLYQGSVVAKDSPLRDVLLEGFRKLIENGTYKKVMTKWGLASNMLDKPGVNLAPREG